MKTKNILFAATMMFSPVFLFAQSKTDSVKVWGICEECKDKIETAAKKAGAVSADWNEESYMLVVNYNSGSTSSLDIEKGIAAVGYDTQDVKATDEAYNKLPKCCQYTRGAEAGTKEN